MKKVLVGYTGFVGSNICEQTNFDFLYNSSNIKEAYGTRPDLLVYSGVPAQKFLANKNPEKDSSSIDDAIENIRLIDPKKVILISTIDVYKNPVGVDENSKIEKVGLEAYGRNRLRLEEWVRANYEDALIVHLPALYGKNLKKNFLYDMIHIIPSMIIEDKFLELAKSDASLLTHYTKDENGFYRYDKIPYREEEKKMKEFFQKSNFTALNFTDSRASYQFYNLKYLWKHIEIALENDIRVLNLATEPIKASEVYSYVEGKDFKNEVAASPIRYDFKTVYDEVYGGKDGYIFDKDFLLRDIAEFIGSERDA